MKTIIIRAAFAIAAIALCILAHTAVVNAKPMNAEQPTNSAYAQFQAATNH